MTSEQTKRFKYWQMRTIIATMVGYALFYFVRKNFSLAMPGLEADLGISKTSLGIFLTLNGLIYGFSRFANGILADRMNARWYMAVGLALCALANFAFGFGEDVSYWITGEHSGDQFGNTMILFMGVMWVVNGLLQGTGFPPCARLLTHWIPPTELATKMSVWNTSHSIGAGLVVILCGYIMGTLGTNMAGDPDAVASIAANLGVSPDDAAGMERVMTSAAHVGAWKWCFWIPSAIAFAGAIGLVVFLRDTPTSVGLPELEGTETRQVKTEKKGAEHKAFLMKYVFKNPLIWILGFANFFVYIVRFSVLDWGPSLLSQSKGVSMSHAGWLVAMFEIAGILGMLFAGWATDKWLKGRAHRTCVFCMAGAALFVFLFWRRSDLAAVHDALRRRVLHLRPAGADRHCRREPGHEEGRRHGQRPHGAVRLRFDARFGCGTGLRGPALRLELGLCRHPGHGRRGHAGLPPDVGRQGRRLRTRGGIRESKVLF